MSEMNEPKLDSSSETPEALPSSQNTPLAVEKKRLSLPAKVTIYFSYLTIIGSLFAAWGAYQEEQANDILAGLGQMIYLGLAVILNVVLLLIHVIHTKL